MLVTGAGESEHREHPESVGKILAGDLDGLNPGPLLVGALEGLGSSRSGVFCWTPLAPEEVQRELPQYTVTSLLGRGGMGAVYQARQDALDRLVAIKILPPGIDHDDLQFAGRFRQEAKAMAKFKHPGIVGVYDAMETPGGLLCIVMECVEGNDVGQLLAREGKISPDEAIRIASKVCEALAYAHGRGVVHRDIKPSNVMLEADGTVKVADFGLAKMTSQNGGGFTRSDMALGSPDFAAPECFLAGTQPDGRADIYSVGVMLYQMLTGMLPRGRFDPPSGVVTQLDRRLDAIIDKAMQTDPGKRYSSALGLKEDLERLISASGAPAISTRRNFVGPRLAGVTVLLGLGIGLAIVWQQTDLKPGGAKSLVATGQNVRPQWQKIEFAAINPAAATQGRPRLSMEGGLLNIRDWDRWAAPASIGTRGTRYQHNVAIRTTFQVRDGSKPKLALRHQHSSESQYYLVAYGRSLSLVRQIGMDMKGLRDFPLPRIPAEGEEVGFQLACVGNRLYVWFDGTLLGQMDDHSFEQAGGFGIQALNGWFKSFEYLPLDGLPEAEALKLIGIGKP